MRRRNRIILWCLVPSACALLVTLCFILPDPDRVASRAESLRLLRNAETRAELEQAVGDLGVFLPLKDGPWIAIRYRDSHGWPMWSQAIARDSGGQWYESREHFCGVFLGYRQYPSTIREMVQYDIAAGRDTAPTTRLFAPSPEIDAVGSAPDLPTARTALIKLGFWRIR